MYAQRIEIIGLQEAEEDVDGSVESSNFAVNSQSEGR
jgi:hypothetical protein